MLIKLMPSRGRYLYHLGPKFRYKQNKIYFGYQGGRQGSSNLYYNEKVPVVTTSRNSRKSVIKLSS